MNTLLKNILASVVLVISLTSTANAADAFSHTVLSLLDDPRNEEAWSLAIDNQKDWEGFYNKPLAYMSFLQGEVPVAPKLDFEKYRILTGGVGVKNTGGFQLVVKDVRERDDELLIHLLMIRPSASCATPQALSYPSATILVEKKDKPFKFVISKLVDECL